MPPKVTVDEMVKAIAEAEKPLTARNIAKRVGVTRQTISNYRDDLEADDRIEYGQVGNATAYWISGCEEQSTSGAQGGADTDSSERGSDSRTKRLAEVAGRWTVDFLGTAFVALFMSQIALLGGRVGLASPPAVEVVYAAIMTVVLGGLLVGGFTLLIAALASAWLWTPAPVLSASRIHTRKRARQFGLQGELA